jgi:ABC-type sugar transport system substrate-binding protein
MKASRITMLLAALLVALGVVVAGCGGSDSSSSTGSETSASTEESGGGKSSAGFEEAQAEAEKWETERTGPEIPKLKKPIPAEAKVRVIGCEITGCTVTDEGAVAAAEELGYEVELKVYQGTPESYQQTFAEVAREEPDIMTFISAFPDETIESSLKSMAESGTAIVQISPQAGEKPNDVVGAVMQGPPFFELGGETAAFKILGTAGEPFKSAVARDPSFGFSQPAQEAYERTVKKYCPECEVELIPVSLVAPGSEQLSQVINFLRQHSDVEYLFYPNSEQSAGLPEGLASAGLSDVQFVTLQPGLTQLEQVAEGKQLAAIQDENFSQGYRAIDGGLRILAEGSAGVESFPDGYTRILSEANVEPGELPKTPGTPQDYQAAWGIK